MQAIKAHTEVPRQYGVEFFFFCCLIFWPLQSNNFLSATVSWVHLGGLFHSPISLQDFPYFLQNIEKNADKFNFTHKKKKVEQVLFRQGGPFSTRLVSTGTYISAQNM